MEASDETSHQLEQLTTTQSQEPLERIGYGSCGSVWADSSLPKHIDEYPPNESASSKPPRPALVVLKRGDGLPDRSLENEAKIHRHILSTLQTSSWLDEVFKTSFQINVPAHIDFLQPDSSIWKNIIPRLPTHSTPCQGLISERILPFPRDIRRLLVEKYWTGSPSAINTIINDKRNDHCLIRPYLGRRKARPASQIEGGSGEPRRKMINSISLRNYPLHIDQIEELGLPSREYAPAMADALAFLLWVCEVDACDVEFVLARPRPTAAGYMKLGESCLIGNRPFTDISESSLGEHALWILDFDCCRMLPITTEGVEIAVERFWRNDPFYPNPNLGSAMKNENDGLLWGVFRERFLEISSRIMDLKCKELQDEGQNLTALPVRFIERVEATVGVYSRGAPRIPGGL